MRPGQGSFAGEGVARVYTKNHFCAGLRYSTRIYVGDYAADNSMAALAGASEVCPAWACAAWMWIIWGSPLSPAMNAPQRAIR